MKLARIASAIAIAASIASPFAVSAGEWWGDDAYWQAQPSQRANVDYAASGTTTRDVPGVDEAPERPTGAAIVERANAERAGLEQAGFPQFNQ
jgi:hypothetical protein